MFLVAGLLIGTMSLVFSPVTAQTQSVTATPGYINLGFTTSVNVTVPAPGAYTVIVQKPNGTEATLGFTASSAGQLQSFTYGNSSLGFKTTVNQVGTYNVFLENGGQVVSSTSFYTTNKLVVTMDMVVGGTCIFVQGVTRGEQLIPRFYVHYASNGAPLTNITKGVSVNFTTPSGQVENAPWDSFASLFDNAVSPNWNYTFVGSWSPTVNASDAYGNFGTLKYSGSPFTITPTQLATNITLVATSTGSKLTSLANGEGMTIMATITYPTNPEPTPGFVAPLSPSRGASVTAQVGWGYYNMTSGTFGGGKTTGALLGTVLMTYTGTNGTFTGQFQSSSLPTLPAGDQYEIVVSSQDGASPTNTGLAIGAIAPAAPATSSTTVTQTSTATQSIVQTVQSIPTVVYAALAILLILGVVIGFVVRFPRS